MFVRSNNTHLFSIKPCENGGEGDKFVVGKIEDELIPDRLACIHCIWAMRLFWWAWKICFRLKFKRTKYYVEFLQPHRQIMSIISKRNEYYRKSSVFSSSRAGIAVLARLDRVKRDWDSIVLFNERCWNWSGIASSKL